MALVLPLPNPNDPSQHEACCPLNDDLAVRWDHRGGYYNHKCSFHNSLYSKNSYFVILNDINHDNSDE